MFIFSKKEKNVLCEDLHVYVLLHKTAIKISLRKTKNSNQNFSGMTKINFQRGKKMLLKI